MILNTCLLVMLSAAWTRNVSGASFSKVFMQAGPEVAPGVEYVLYGAPSASYGTPQIAQLNAAPIGSVVPLPSTYSYGVPCSSPCIYPGQTIAAVAPVPPSANIVAYKSPISSAPVASTPSANAPAGYEYSYLVYDQSTGDHKVHSELSDGTVVRGEYSFLQPDGLIREVQYVADDVTGFNAIVKNFLPVGDTKHTETTVAPPCTDVKSESLKTLENHDGHEELNEPEPREKKLQVLKEQHSGYKKQHDIQEKSPTSKGQKEPESQKEESIENKEQEKPKESSAESSEENEQEKSEESSLEASEEKESEIPTHENLQALLSHTVENVIEGFYVNAPKTKVLTKEPNEAPPSVKPQKAATAELTVIESNAFISYNDVIKCIESAISNIRENPDIPRTESPLTYLVYNKIC